MRTDGRTWETGLTGSVLLGEAMVAQRPDVKIDFTVGLLVGSGGLQE